MGLRVGVPRGLYFDTFQPMWESFFRTVGVECVVSGLTNKETVDLGVLTTVTDACAPIKVFQGHAASLVGKVDRIFVPRMVNVESKFVFCPKFLGLPDMVRATIDGLPDIIDTRIDLRKGPLVLFRTLYRLARDLGANTAIAARAAYSAARTLRNSLSGLADEEPLPCVDQSKARMAVIGYPYLVHDHFVNCGLLKLLRSMGVTAITMEQVAEADVRRQVKRLGKDIFWQYSNRALGASYHLMENGDIDGLIHVTAFGCGPDAIVDKYLEIDSRDSKLPFLSVTVDEHSGEAGIQTRIEAFADMVIRKRSLISTPEGRIEPDNSGSSGEKRKPTGRRVS